MKTTGIMLLASAALTGIALLIWNRFINTDPVGLEFDSVPPGAPEY